MTAEFDEDRFNMAIRKFLKHVGVTSQREIENLDDRFHETCDHGAG